MILVTGGGGFIGSAVCAELERRNIRARVLDLPDGDVRSIEGMQKAVEGCDVVIHLAGVLGTHELFDFPRLAIDVNIVGTLNVLEACREHGAGYVGITMPPVFPSIYTATKTAATRFASAYHHRYGMRVSHVRAFNAFGPGQAHGPPHPQKIIPTFAMAAWSNRPIPIWGDGTQTVDLIYTRDLARMLVDATRFGNDQTFDGGTGEPISVNDLATWVLNYTGSTGGVIHLPMRRGEIPTHIFAEGEGWARLGWRPELDMNTLRETLDWYKERRPVKSADQMSARADVLVTGDVEGTR
jgi:UDP-glucose 4-epimerase